MLLIFDVKDNLLTSNRNALFEFDLKETVIGILKYHASSSIIFQIVISVTSFTHTSFQLSPIMELH
jgi:hypothetical protein